MIVKIVLFFGIAVILCILGTLSSIWVGHIPKKYTFNKELPKAFTLMSWTNMSSPIVQNALKKNIIAETAKLEVCEPPKGFLMTKTFVVVKENKIPLYCIEPEDLEGKKNVPALLYVHGGAFYYPLSKQGGYSMAYYAE